MNNDLRCKIAPCSELVCDMRGVKSGAGGGEKTGPGGGQGVGRWRVSCDGDTLREQLLARLAAWLGLNIVRHRASHYQWSLTPPPAKYREYRTERGSQHLIHFLVILLKQSLGDIPGAGVRK